MTTYDDYFQNADKPYAENINDALLLSNVFDMTVTIELPKMYSDSSFHDNNTTYKCGVAQVTLKNPSDFTVNSDSIVCGSTAKTLKLGFYPNFNSFGALTKVEWVTTGSASVDIYDASGTLIAEDINNGVIDNPPSSLRTLKEFEFRIHMQSESLTKFTVTMTNKSTNRYGATVGISDVTGLSEAIAGKAEATHTHGNLSSDGKVGSEANKPLITTTGGVVTTGSFGTSANTFCQGNDSRLSDARTPTSHTHGAITNTGTILDDIENVKRVLVTDSNNQIKTIAELPVASITTPDISMKQDKANLVTSWSSTTSDSKYPSEKLTKDSLDGKSNTGHSHTWSSITSKPSSFTPSSHSHSWDSITSKPSTFTPSSHSHGSISNTGTLSATTSSVNKLVVTDSSNNIKAASSITKSMISDFPTSLPPGSHTHGSISNTGTLSSDITSVNKIVVTDSSNNIKTISSIPKSKISDFPSTMTPSSHSHGSISNDGKIGSASGKVVTTGTSGALQASSTISQSSVDGLTTALSGKASTNKNTSVTTFTKAISSMGGQGQGMIRNGFAYVTINVSWNVSLMNSGQVLVKTTNSDFRPVSTTAKPEFPCTVYNTNTGKIELGNVTVYWTGSELEYRYYGVTSFIQSGTGFSTSFVYPILNY